MKKKSLLLLPLLLCLLLIKSCTTPEESIIHLSDMNWESVTVGYDSPQIDKGLEGLPLRLRTSGDSIVTYEKGLCLHAKSKVTYNIEELHALKFQSYIGINYSKKGGSCAFVVWGDSTKLYESEVLYETSLGQYIDIDIPANVKKLILETNDGGDGITADHSIWADAKLVLNPKYKLPVRTIDFDIVPGIINTGDKAATAIKIYLLNNKLLDAAKTSVSYTSSNPQVATIDKKGIVTGMAAGSATLTCTIKYNGKTTIKTSNCIVDNGDNENSWIIQSPDNSIKVGFALDTDGKVSYTGYKDGKPLTLFSATGLVTDLGDFTNGLRYEGHTTNFIEDNYELIGAKTSYVESKCNELSLHFSKENVLFKVTARAYNDGFAFRYGIEMKDESIQKLNISSEQTTLQLPYGSVSQAMSYVSHHEAVAYEKKTSELNENYIMPFLYQTTDDIWVLVSEAALTPEYCGAQIKGNTNGRLDIIFSEEQRSDVNTKTSFESPWRFVVAGTPKTIVENTMPENLSPAVDQNVFTTGTGWVKPGVSAWTWLNRESTSDLNTYKKYVDMAAEMGWEYLLLDEGWQPKSTQQGYVYYGYFGWTAELINYANKKGVGLLVWANNYDLNTEAKRSKSFSEWQAMGFKGVKPDFFNSQSQYQIQFYDALMKETAKHKLLLNPHGANKTTGERKTYPNTLTREGVFGAEQDLFKPAEMSARWNCMLPFTRNAVGPADFTPMLSYRVSGNRRNYTVSHMAAMTIVYESGIQCLADRAEVYLNSPARPLLEKLPASWHESILIDGIPGEYVNIARRHHDIWYVGIMCNDERTVNFAFDFLNDGIYNAYIYSDGDTFDEIKTEVLEGITKGSEATFNIPKTGGTSIKIIRSDS